MTIKWSMRNDCEEKEQHEEKKNIQSTLHRKLANKFKHHKRTFQLVNLVYDCELVRVCVCLYGAVEMMMMARPRSIAKHRTNNHICVIKYCKACVQHFTNDFCMDGFIFYILYYIYMYKNGVRVYLFVCLFRKACCTFVCV